VEHLSLRRIIPTVIVDEGKSFHRTRFKTDVYLGDPINICKIYSEKNCDEIVVLDISRRKRNTMLMSGKLARLTSNVFVPISYGGGVSTTNEVQEVFNCGIEKIVVKFGSKNWLGLIKFCSENFGSQSVVLNFNLSDRYWIYRFSRKYFKLNEIDLALKRIEHLPIGEILIQIIDISGTRQGPDFDTISKVLPLTKLPTIYGGGVGCEEDIFKLFSLGVDAVSVSTLFSLQSGSGSPLLTYIDPEKRELMGY
jgi:cyclase